MKSGFESQPKQHQSWIEGYVNGTLETEEFEAFQQALASDGSLRRMTRRYLALDDHLRRGSEDSDGSMADVVAAPARPVRSLRSSFHQGWQVALAACVAFGLGLALVFLRPEPAVTAAEATDDVASGYAVITRVFDADWPDGAIHSEGDTLGDETITLREGAAEIRFFCGASVTLRAPARLTLESAWSATCHEGSLRVQVPPAARGFRLNAPDTEIVDLGTEFGLEVADGQSKVAVFDGEIAMRHRDGPEQRVGAGVAWTLPIDGEPEPLGSDALQVPDPELLGPRLDDQRRASFGSWQSQRDRLARDPRLIAYYSFDQPRSDVMIPNLAVPRNAEHDGAIILAEAVDGRWPGRKQALEFRRPGSRVRVHIPGEFQAFTFSAWVRIDSLERRYSALFMGDGYETGEPHWQIRDDGMLMLSVMVDDTKPNPKMPEDAGFHRVYFSSPIWDISKSGQWMHLSSVFDPAHREVRHYVNGNCVSRQEIEPDYFIDTLRIGNAEIGNWGQPFRDTPWFAIRHLNGRIDELALFGTALTDAEVAELHRASSGVLDE
jgi:hypothetical protein